MDKAPDAFRTISEVAEVLETPAHVLRFWESRFPQIKPVKRAGGRRYYRPADVALLSGIRQLLHTEGMTIRGVQKVLREQGVRHVAALGGDVSDLDLETDLEIDAEDVVEAAVSRVVVPITSLPRRAPAAAPEPPAEAAPAAPPEPSAEAAPVAAAAAPPATPVEAAVASLFAAPAPEARPVPGFGYPADPGLDLTDVPRDGGGGFIAFSSPRTGRHRPSLDPQQPSLPFDVEAGHVFVEVEPVAPATVTPLTAAPEAASLAPEAAAEPEPDSIEPQAPDLAGLSARLRQLPLPVLPEAAAVLAEVQARLGLLHAQMAEAQRLRRPTV